MTNTTRTYTDIWVCEDCYFAHHYGSSEHDGQWFAGDSDSPADREPLALISDTVEVTDNTCSNHEYDRWDLDPHDPASEAPPCPHCGQADDENGIDTFSWSACQGCGSTLGGARYRLAMWED